MARLISTFAALFCAMLLLMIGSGLLGTFLSLRMTIEGFSRQMTAFVMADYYAGMVLGGLYCQRLVHQVGHIRSFAAFAAVTTVSILVQAIYIHPVAWGLFRFLTGIAMTGLFMVVESWLNECSESSTRGRVFSIYMILNYLGLTGGQFLLNLADIRGTEPFLFSAALICLCLVPVVVTRSVNPEPPQKVSVNLPGLLSQAPIGLLGCLTAGLLNGAFYTMAPVFALNHGLAVSDVAWFISITIFSGLILQWPVGVLSDRIDRRRFLGGLCLVVAAVSLAMALLAGRSPWMIFVLGAAYGGPAFTIYPVAVALTHDLVHPDEVVQASSALILFFAVGAFIGPNLAAPLMQKMGPQGLYFYLAACSMLFAALAYLRWKRTPVDVPEPVPFMPMARTTPAVAALDPRLEIEPAGEPR